MESDMSNELETYDELVTRIAYNIVNGVARGVSAIDMAGTVTSQTLMWRQVRDRAEAEAKKAKRSTRCE